MVAYYFSFKTALVKGSPNVVAANATVLIYDATDVNRTTPLQAYSDPGLTTITNLVSDAYGIVPDFYTNNLPDVLWKSGSFKGQWATSQSRPGVRGATGPEGPPGIQGPQGNPGLNGAGTNADVAAYVGASGQTRDALDARYVGINSLDEMAAGEINDPGSATSVALGLQYEVKGGAPGALQSLAGLYSARPAASTVPNGSLYNATDVQETYRSNAAAWAVVGGAGCELGFAEIVGVPMQSTTSTTGVDVPGMTISFTAGERPVWIAIKCQLANGTTGKTTTAQILVDGVVKETFPFTALAADTWGIPLVRGGVRVPGLTPGQTYVASLQFKAETPSTARFGSDAYLQVVNL